MTTTKIRPPTEAAIRQALEPAFQDNGSLNVRGELEDAFGTGSNILNALYDLDDFRATEVDALDTAIYEAMVPIRDRAIDELHEALVGASLRFAAEHPDAPRARPPVTVETRFREAVSSIVDEALKGRVLPGD